MEQPLVSCLMVSRGNGFPAELAIECYRAQTYANRELVIVSAQPANEVEALVRRLDDPTIRYVQAENIPLGDLRNLSVDAASGSLLCLWDDDDLYHPRRIELQTAALLQAGATAHFLSRVVLWWPQRRIITITGERPWENTMLARREALPRYPSVRIREDTPLLSELECHGEIAVTNDPELYCYVVHGQNTSDAAHFEYLLDGASSAATDYEGEVARLSRFYPIDRYRSLLKVEHAFNADGLNRWAEIVEVVANKNFGKGKLRIDGTRFVACSFDGTDLVYAGGKVPVFEDCRFSNNKFELYGSAYNTFELFRLLKGAGLISGI